MLNGIRVLDFSQYLPGPFASLRLAEMGAEVIKIEPPHGDPARQLSEGVVFRANNRNKQSKTFNLKDSLEKNELKKLIQTADVLLESFRPGVMKKHGLSYEEVKAFHPTVIYCSLSGYGHDSPLAHLGSHDLNYMALSGVLTHFSDHSGRPVHPTTTLADLVGGTVASEAILAAIIKKLRTGDGAYIDLAITDMMVGLQTNHVLYEKEKISKKGIPEIDGSNISYHLYETKDGRYISIAALEMKFWKEFCIWAGKERWIEAHLSAANETNAVYHEVKAFFKTYTFEQWLKFSMEVDACLAPVLSIEELPHHPHVKKRELIFEPQWGDRQVRVTPFKNSHTNRPPMLSSK
ncbi:CoA transferase [Bacillus aquiflavi]|uniref:CoA transferase n=1 Tax=Bacillus aquiflavi TaxID=2672567 RepID=A0A6B3VSG1_9BACI|nr:CaiB/BaiF CoA-transferase family protein [Bacillus aquiflavi]MBA4536542.1 CoA transferase [Bacillus aquiflavi]NEY80909.1 CoA transferase [Bacillus aquiflavi]UAC49629.1 CoA transferase [Bacillus aquiflavi]